MTLPQAPTTARPDTPHMPTPRRAQPHTPDPGPEGESPVQVSVRLSPELRRKLDELLQMHRDATGDSECSLNAYVRQLIHQTHRTATRNRK